MLDSCDDEESMVSIVVEELTDEDGELSSGELGPSNSGKINSVRNPNYSSNSKRNIIDSGNRISSVNETSLGNDEFIHSESEEDDPTSCGHFNVVVLDDENENVILVDEDEAENSVSCETSDYEGEIEDDPGHETLRAIVEEGFVICSNNEVEPAAISSKAIVQNAKFKGSGWNGRHNLEVSVNMAVYPPLERLPDKSGAFIFNGHKYYTVKGGRPGVTYYTCWRARKKGTCPVRCRVRSDGTVEVSGEHDHSPISLSEEVRTDFKRHLREACLNAGGEVPLKEVYYSVADQFPEGAKLLPFGQARRLMLVCRHAAHDLPLKKTPKPPEQHFPPNPNRRCVPGRGYFLEGFKYYKMKSGLNATYFKCSEAKRGCRACCRVKKSDGSAIVSGVHIHKPNDDGSVFLVDNFKAELQAALNNPASKGKNIREVYRMAADKDPVGSELYPYDVAKHFLFKRRGRVIPPRPPEVRHPPVEIPPYGKRFIHLNHKYHLVKKRAGKAMYYKCGQWKLGCQVNLRILSDGTVVVVGKHTHEPASEIEIEQRRLMEELRLSVLSAGPLLTLRQIYDSTMSREGNEKGYIIYPWKHAWYFMERIRRKKIQEEQIASAKEEQIPSVKEEPVALLENEELVMTKESYYKSEPEELGQIDYYELIDEEGNVIHQKLNRSVTHYEIQDAEEGDVKYGIYLGEDDEVEEIDMEESYEELDFSTEEILKHSNIMVKTGQLDLDKFNCNNQYLSVRSPAKINTSVQKVPKKPRARKKTPITIDPNVKRVVIVPVYPQNMVEENIPELNEEEEEQMYHEVIVNEDGSMEPAIIFMEDEVPSEVTIA